MTFNPFWKYSLSPKAGPAHFTKYITTVTVYQATFNIHSQVTSANPDLKSCVQFDHSGCAFPQPHWLSQTSIFNSEWRGVMLGLHFHSLEWARSQPCSPLQQCHSTNSAAEMHRMKSWKLHHTTRFVRQRCADNEHRTASLQSFGLVNLFVARKALIQVYSIISLVLHNKKEHREFFPQQRAQRAQPVLCSHMRPNKALWTPKQSMLLRPNIVADWKIPSLAAFSCQRTLTSRAV